MATSANFSFADLLDHPMAVYARESDAALSTVRGEISRLKLRQDDENLSDEERKESLRPGNAVSTLWVAWRRKG